MPEVVRIPSTRTAGQERSALVMLYVPAVWFLRATHRCANGRADGAAFSDALISDLIAARLVSERGWVEVHRWTKSELLVAANEISHWLGDLAKGTLNEGGYYATSISAPSPSRAPIGSNDQLSATA
jgi:hypothetical protein